MLDVRYFDFTGYCELMVEWFDVNDVVSSLNLSLMFGESVDVDLLRASEARLDGIGKNIDKWLSDNHDMVEEFYQYLGVVRESGDDGICCFTYGVSHDFSEGHFHMFSHRQRFSLWKYFEKILRDEGYIK